MDLGGKRALVTGASRGIGRASWELAGTGVDLTVVELGPIPTDMLANVQKHRPTEAGFQCLYRLGLIVDVPATTVADHVVRAIERRHRRVRLPRRGTLFPMLRASSQRIIRVICAGIPTR